MAGYQYDFAAIKAAHKIEDVAAKLGLELTTKNGQLRGKCPSGKGGDRALVLTPAKQVFFSFGEHTGGDCIQLVAFVNKVSVKEAAAWIQGDTPPTVPEEKAPEARGGFKALDYLDPDHAAVQMFFEPSVAKALGIGYASRGILRGTIAVPVRNPDGSIAGYLGLTEIDKLPPDWKLT